MLKKAYFLAKIGADTAENEQHFAEILPIGSSRRLPAPDPSLAIMRWPQFTARSTSAGSYKFSCKDFITVIASFLLPLCAKMAPIPSSAAYVYSDFFSNFWLIFGKLWEARSRLYRRRILQVNSHFSAFFEICKIDKPSHRSEFENLQISLFFQNYFCLFAEIFVTRC